MSIIIKGMNMPTARDTLVLVKTDGTAIVYVDEAYVTTAYPVPPHGRLIDADALICTIIETLESLKKNPKMDREEAHLLAAFHTLGEMVKDAPIIVETEEEEK